MNHLQKAQEEMEHYYERDMHVESQYIQAHAMIAIAEGIANQNKTLDLLLVGLCKKTGKIAEQFEKRNKFMAQLYTGTSQTELVDIAIELGFFPFEFTNVKE